MNNTHKNEEARHLMEEHKRNASASMLFTALRHTQIDHMLAALLSDNDV